MRRTSMIDNPFRCDVGFGPELQFNYRAPHDCSQPNQCAREDRPSARSPLDQQLKK